jgi:hypothetical protein
VGLAIVAVIFVIAQTAMLNMEIVKGSLLAAMFAISADEKTALEEDVRSNPASLPPAVTKALESGVAGEFRRRGRRWVLGSM